MPGVVALITERLLYRSAFGMADVATGRPLTSDALFRIASMTKPITSLALMQLVEQGRLSLCLAGFMPAPPGPAQDSDASR